MLKQLLSAAVVVAAMSALTACDSDNKHDYEPNPDQPKYSAGAYFLNQGSFSEGGGIEGGLYSLDYTTGTMANNIFKAANNKSLGDTPQCGVCYGSKVYIGVYMSQCIFIMDKYTNKELRCIRLKGMKQGSQPRSMVAHGGKVYVAMYDGYVTRLDTTTMQIDKSVQVGPNPETIGIYNNKIYVPNSDGMNYLSGYGTTASVIDIDSFTVTATITVPLNPAEFQANKDGLYLLAKGNYQDIPSKIYKVEGLEFKEIAEASIMAVDEDKVYYVNAPFTDDVKVTYGYYDIAKDMNQEWRIQQVDYPNNIAIDRIGGKMFISSYIMDGKYPSYTAPGYVNEYTLDGKFVKKYDIGVGPAAIFFDKY